MSPADVSPDVRLSRRYTDAVDRARHLHADDVRKGTALPYLSHVLAVSSLVLEYGGDENQAIAALLHDAAEDHGGQAQLDQIRDEFGADVTAIVDACSDDLPAAGAPKRPWWERKVVHLDRMRTEDPRAALVPTADKVHNLRSTLADYRAVGSELWATFNGGRIGTLWYYRRLAALLPDRVESLGPRAAMLAEALVLLEHELRSAVEREEQLDDTELDNEWKVALEREATERAAVGLGD